MSLIHSCNQSHKRSIFNHGGGTRSPATGGGIPQSHDVNTMDCVWDNMERQNRPTEEHVLRDTGNKLHEKYVLIKFLLLNVYYSCFCIVLLRPPLSLQTVVTH